MMTSTFPQSRSCSSRSLESSLQQIQTKRGTLKSLEAALKRRLVEFRELCLKEGEITGQLPGDYPLQPREPIPQVRRRRPTTTTKSDSNSNLSNDTNSISPPASVVSSSHRIDPVQPHSAFAISSNGQVIFPPRPMSTNSTSSSISTASSNTRSINQQQQQQTNMLATPTISSSSSNSRLDGGSAYPMRYMVVRNNHHQLPVHYDNGYQQHQLKQVRKFDSVDGDLKSIAENRYQPTTNQPATKLSESSSLRALQHINIDGKGSYVPYYEETKPFQMSDFYKYSSKHRQKVITTNEPPATKTKTTRQLQEDVKKNSFKYSSCDDQKIQNSMKIIEKSGQKLIEATAKAIAVNPGLAEKLSSILPNNGDKY